MPDSYQLYFIRHGVAEERGDKWPDDAKRPLSEDGVARLRKCARGLSALGVKFDVILTSPLVRARQTAEIIAGVSIPARPLFPWTRCPPAGVIRTCSPTSKSNRGGDGIALVGHETAIGEIAARFAGSRHRFPFKKGAVCLIELETMPPGRPGTLLWFLTPRILRSIKK